MLGSNCSRFFAFSTSLIAGLTISASSVLALPFVHTGAAETEPATEDLSYKTPVPEAADIVFRNGAICTMDPARSWCQAVVIKRGRIVFVGSDEKVKPWIGSQTKTIDLNG